MQKYSYRVPPKKHRRTNSAKKRGLERSLLQSVDFALSLVWLTLCPHCQARNHRARLLNNAQLKVSENLEEKSRYFQATRTSWNVNKAFSCNQLVTPTALIACMPNRIFEPNYSRNHDAEGNFVLSMYKLMSNNYGLSQFTTANNVSSRDKREVSIPCYRYSTGYECNVERMQEDCFALERSNILHSHCSLTFCERI